MKRRSPDVDPEGDNGLSGIVDGALLAGALEAAFAGTHVPLGADARRPLFKGTLDEFAVANAGDVALLRHLKNNVKKCGACGHCRLKVSVAPWCSRERARLPRTSAMRTKRPSKPSATASGSAGDRSPIDARRVIAAGGADSGRTR